MTAFDGQMHSGIAASDSRRPVKNPKMARPCHFYGLPRATIPCQDLSISVKVSFPLISFSTTDRLPPIVHARVLFLKLPPNR